MYAFLLRDALQKRGLCSGKMSVSLSHAGIVGVQGQQHKQHTENALSIPYPIVACVAYGPIAHWVLQGDPKSKEI